MPSEAPPSRHPSALLCPPPGCPSPCLARANPDNRAQKVPPPPGRPPGLIESLGFCGRQWDVWLITECQVLGGAVPRSPEWGQGEAEAVQGAGGVVHS